MKPLQSINPSSSATNRLPQETITEREKMKASTFSTMNWLKGVQEKGDEAIKEVLSTGKDVIMETEWLKQVLAQDKEDTNLLLQKTKTLMEYTWDRLVSGGILPSSRAVEPWEWFEALKIRQKVLKNIYKQMKQIDDTLTGVYNGSIAFFEIMIGRRKITPKYLSLEQLREWWHDVYAPLDDGSISKHQMDDMATYLVVIDKHVTYKVDWDRSVKHSRDKIASIER